jgi:autotransporter passenger strand-loop-strand repeat protein
MTTFTAPPTQDSLNLESGDVLDVNQGGTATNTFVPQGAREIVAGGDAVNTILDGGIEIVDSGTADGVTLAEGSTLVVANPTLLKGVLTLDGPDSNIEFGTSIDSISNTGDTLTVTYGDNKTTTYDYTSGVSVVVTFFLNKFDNDIMVTVHDTRGAPLPGHSPPPEQALHHFTGERHSTGTVGILHHLGEFHA